MDKINESIRIYVLSVSGKCFLNQVANVCNTSDALSMMHKRVKGGIQSSSDYCPNICISSSGGNIVSYSGNAGDWESDKILNIVKQLESDMFIKSWLPNELKVLPSWMIGTFNGSVYKQGYGSQHMFNSLFTSETVKRTEIWTGTYDTHNCRTQLFCNLSPEDSLINHNIFDKERHIYDSNSLKHLNGDIKSISNASTASASIPVLVQKQEINGMFFQDGGVTYASPLSVLSNEICRIISNKYYGQIDSNKFIFRDGKIVSFDNIEERVRPLRLFYFTLEQLENRKESCGDSEIGKIQEVTRQIFHSSCIHDKNKCLDILYRVCNNDIGNIIEGHKHCLNIKIYSELLEMLETKLHYVIIIYPHGSPQLNSYIFTKEELEEIINKTREKFGCYYWFYNKNL